MKEIRLTLVEDDGSEMTYVVMTTTFEMSQSANIVPVRTTGIPSPVAYVRGVTPPAEISFKGFVLNTVKTELDPPIVATVVEEEPPGAFREFLEGSPSAPH